MTHTAPMPRNESPFYKFTAEAGDEPTSAELLIFDVIGSWDEIGEVSAKAFARDLAALPKSVKRLDLHINSPGGSVYDAQGIYSRLADHPAQKVVYIDGLAASAASLVAMVGHKIFIRANANIMIHSPSAITLGTEEDHQKTIRALQSITGAMLNTYTKRTGLAREEIKDMLAAETWMTAEEAVEKGFADEVRGVIKAAAILDDRRVIVNGHEFDLSRFKNIPAFTATTTQTRKQTMNTPQNTPQAAADPPTPTPTPTPTPPTPTPPQPQPAPTGDQPPAAAAAPAATASAAPPENDLQRGARLERERVTALQALDRPATHDIIVNAIKDGKTVADVTAACIDAMDKSNKQSARRADASVLNTVRGSDSGELDTENDFGALLTSKVQSCLKGRGHRTVLNSRN